MTSNSFGKIFRITTWGESHGKAIGVVIDGCPAGLALNDDDINKALAKRAPGKNPYTSPRQEQDIGSIYSGVFEGQTTGAPISIIIPNKDADSSKYTALKNLLRPGHANFTYQEKYKIFDYHGGGRASARETAGRVAAAAVANKLINHYGIMVVSYLSQIKDVTLPSAFIKKLVDNPSLINSKELHILIDSDPLYCPEPNTSLIWQKLLSDAKVNGDSLGGVVGFLIIGLPVGLGDPVYEKLEANLAKAMMSLPATKGFEMGAGFHAATLLGSEHNDLFTKQNDRIVTQSNTSGGTLGGISTGMPLYGQVAFKPTSSIQKPQMTLDEEGQTQILKLPEGSRHDPCVAIRGVPCVAAMCSLVIADALLCNRSSRVDL